MKNIILGVTGSIAAYKSADIANSLTKLGNDVHVVMSELATKFITPLTLKTLSKNKVYINMFEDYVPEEVEHVSLVSRADLILIAPSTANFIAKIANGLADDMLTSIVLASKDVPILICPAMNTGMYKNKITQKNINFLKSLGYFFMEPRESKLACGDFGKGALANLEDILVQVDKIMKQ